ncbi:hypothetical protein NDU88_005211 [Pleurodeles waltl]|uniref:Uncharacterized protein n=1 Tax=Pleurodeles waltl TaxID=8319 RepID=A0AAV7VLC6_PLEWA|nr:hypothetical protein NDU88_005211 [Pleurodeles waltl]
MLLLVPAKFASAPLGLPDHILPRERPVLEKILRIIPLGRGRRRAGREGTQVRPCYFILGHRPQRTSRAPSYHRVLRCQIILKSVGGARPCAALEQSVQEGRSLLPRHCPVQSAGGQRGVSVPPRISCLRRAGTVDRRSFADFSKAGLRADCPSRSLCVVPTGVVSAQIAPKRRSRRVGRALTLGCSQRLPCHPKPCNGRRLMRRRPISGSVAPSSMALGSSESR